MQVRLNTKGIGWGTTEEEITMNHQGFNQNKTVQI